MPRAVPSGWKPKGIEILVVRHLYDAPARSMLLTLLGAASASTTHRLQLLNRSLNAAALLRTELHYAKKPRRAQVEASLAPIRSATRTVGALLSGLDDETKRLLEHAADKDAIANERRGNETPRFTNSVTIQGEERVFVTTLGPERIRAVARAIADLQRWADAAPELMPEQLEPRTLRKRAIRSSIEVLEEVWKDAWAGRGRADPTLSVFLPFVQAVLNPVLAEDGSPEDLRRATEDVLHGAQESAPTE